MIYSVTTAHVPNPDLHGGDTPGYWEDPGASGRERTLVVRSLSEASAVCRAYILRHHLGGGNWTGGAVRDADDNLVGHVAYNGRVFAPAAPGKPAWDYGDCLWEKI